jgi:hypothetical protein
MTGVTFKIFEERTRRSATLRASVANYHKQQARLNRQHSADVVFPPALLRTINLLQLVQCICNAAILWNLDYRRELTFKSVRRSCQPA